MRNRLCLLPVVILSLHCSSSPGGSPDAGSNDTDAGPTVIPCAPKASCEAVDVSCLGLVDNTGKTQFGLRMSELDFAKPAALNAGLFSESVINAVEPSLPACNLAGTGTFSWLLQFDLTAGTLTTGGALPVPDPTTGYSFDTGTLSGGITLAPVTYSIAPPSSSGAFSTTAGQNLVIPVFLDAAGEEVIPLPLQQLQFTMGTLSASQNCIGTYNAATLQPQNSCQPMAPMTAFADAGALSGFIDLATADSIVIAPVSATLCAMLTNNPTMYVTDMNGITSCSKDANGNIVFQGDWCSTTNAPAQNGCADSVSVSASFAASSVLINQ